MSVRTEMVRIDLTLEAPFALGALRVTPATREVALGERREILEPRVMQVLTALARRRGEIVTRDELIATCWENRAVGDDAINRCTARVRRLSQDFGDFALETVPRVGYRLTVESAPPDAVSAPVTIGRRKGLAIWALGAAVVGLIVAWAWMKPLAPPVHPVIAVLPFTALSPDPGAQLYGDRAAASVAETLSKMGEPIVPTAESFQYRGSAKARAARELSAMFIIDGEVVRENGKVRISMHFDDTRLGTTVFARTFEESAEDADALPDRVAGYIAAITWGQDMTLWGGMNLAAVFRALEQQNRGDYFAAHETARELVQADPDAASLQIIYAWSAVNLIYHAPLSRKPELVAEARQAAEAAMRLDPKSADGNAVLASITPNFLWAEREAYVRKALAARPDAVGYAMFLTWLLDERGQFREAADSAKSAYERFPYHKISAQRQAEQLLGAGDGAGALQVLTQSRRLWPEDGVLLDLAFEAVALQGVPADPNAFLRDRHVTRYLTGPRQEVWTNVMRALRTRSASDIAALSDSCSRGGEMWWSCMIAMVQLGRLDDAYRIAAAVYPDQRAPTREAVTRKWLTRLDLPTTRYLFLPTMAPMRADPRFKDLAERTGLLQFWQSQRRPPDFCASERAPVCLLLR